MPVRRKLNNCWGIPVPGILIMEDQTVLIFKSKQSGTKYHYLHICSYEASALCSLLPLLQDARKRQLRLLTDDRLDLTPVHILQILTFFLYKQARIQQNAAATIRDDSGSTVAVVHVYVGFACHYFYCYYCCCCCCYHCCCYCYLSLIHI